MANNQKQSGSPFKWVQFIGPAVNLAGGIIEYSAANKRAKEAEDRLETAETEFNQMKEVYSDVDTSNPFENLTNQFAGMENTMEDLTVNQQQAEFQAQHVQQQQANIMSGLKGAAGASGIAALAQTMAQQGQLASQQASASIGMQEAQNQQAMAQQAGQLQMQEAEGAANVQQMIAQGQQGAQQLEMQKQQTLMNLAGDQRAHAQQQADAAGTAKTQALTSMIGGVGDFAGAIFGG